MVKVVYSAVRAGRPLLAWRTPSRRLRGACGADGWLGLVSGGLDKVFSVRRHLAGRRVRLGRVVGSGSGFITGAPGWRSAYRPLLPAVGVWLITV